MRVRLVQKQSSSCLIGLQHTPGQLLQTLCWICVAVRACQPCKIFWPPDTRTSAGAGPAWERDTCVSQVNRVTCRTVAFTSCNKGAGQPGGGAAAA